jgi:transposase-like protein
VDETYIIVLGEWKYLYRAVDSQGNTLDFMLSAKRDARAAERFFRKVLKSTHNQKPRVINVDKNAAYPPAIDELKKDQTLPETTELRPVKYLNNIVELFAPSAQTIGQSRNGVWLVQYSETNVERL